MASKKPRYGETISETETEYKGIKVGDLITTVEPGLYELLKIITRHQTNPMFVYVQIFHEDGTKFKWGKQDECDASHCKKLTWETIQEKRNVDNDKWDRIDAIARDWNGPKESK